MEIKAMARVQLMIEMDLAQYWGSDCPINQLYKQAADDALDRVRLIVKNANCRVVGQPKVTGILTSEA